MNELNVQKYEMNLNLIKIHCYLLKKLIKKLNKDNQPKLNSFMNDNFILFLNQLMELVPPDQTKNPIVILNSIFSKQLMSIKKFVIKIINVLYAYFNNNSNNID